VAYPIATQPEQARPATTWSTNYNTVYPEANRPVTAWTINYNTNYNTVYPIANRPEATRPATAWTINYNSNYNVVYPIATQPEAARRNPGTAPTVSPTVVSYYDYPDNSNYPVTVPPGGQVNVTLE